MPRGPSGIYTLPPSYLAVSGETIEPEQHNPPLEDIAQALTDSLPRSGVAPMTGNLQMGANKITNLAAGTDAGDAVRRDQVAGLVPLGTIATQDADAVNIDGGAIDGAVIGANTPAAATFTGATLTGNAPALLFVEQDANDAFEQTYIDAQDGQLRFITRSSTGTVVSIDHTMTKGASGVTSWTWRIADALTTGILEFEPLGFGASVFGPAAGTIQLGSSSARFSGIFLSASPNVSSDARLKDGIRDLNDAERRAAAKISPRTFTMNGQRKVGYIAQEIIEAMASEGLDAFEYGLVTDGETYGVDYDAIAAFRSIA